MIDPIVVMRERDVYELQPFGSGCFDGHDPRACSQFDVGRGTLHYCAACSAHWFVEKRQDQTEAHQEGK